MKMQVRVKRRAEAVDEHHGAEAGGGAAAGTVFAQAALDHAQQDAHDHALQRRIFVQEVAQPLGYGQHPLPQRQRRQYVIEEMRRGRHHAPGVARRAFRPALAGESHQEVAPALFAEAPGKAMGKDGTDRGQASRIAQLARSHLPLLMPS